MGWHAIIEVATNRLHCLAEDTELRDIPPDFRLVVLAAQPTDDEEWDAKTETFARRPIPVSGNLVDDILGDPSMVLLPVVQKNNLRAVLEARMPDEIKVYTK